MLSNLIHITAARIVFEIVEKGAFHSNGVNQHYDGGMNLLGVLGQYANTEPKCSGARLICSWAGKVSSPLPFTYTGPQSKNVMLDFNGSGAHFPSNDPRYLLPNGSAELIVDDIQFDSDDQLLEGWCYFRSGTRAKLHKRGLFPKVLLWEAKREVSQIRLKCKNGEIKLNVKYVPRM
jgi:hypothetical protein